MYSSYESYGTEKSKLGCVSLLNISLHRSMNLSVGQKLIASDNTVLLEERKAKYFSKRKVQLLLKTLFFQIIQDSRVQDVVVSKGAALQ